MPTVAATARRCCARSTDGTRFLDADGLLMNVIALDILDGTIQAIRTVVNPDKLHHVGPLVTDDHPLRGGGRRHQQP